MKEAYLSTHILAVSPVLCIYPWFLSQEDCSSVFQWQRPSDLQEFSSFLTLVVSCYSKFVLLTPFCVFWLHFGGRLYRWLPYELLVHIHPCLPHYYFCQLVSCTLAITFQFLFVHLLTLKLLYFEYFYRNSQKLVYLKTVFELLLWLVFI